MPSQERSLAITAAYGRRLKAIERRVKAIARSNWNLGLGDFDRPYASWYRVTIAAVKEAQRQNVNLTAAYIAAFLSSETGRLVRPPRVNTSDYVGRTGDNRTLEEAFESPLIQTKKAIAKGLAPEAAAGVGLSMALGMVNLDTYAAARFSFSDTLSGQAVGYRRVLNGSKNCAACIALANNEVLPITQEFYRHPGCDCTQMPTYSNLADDFLFPTGEEVFNSSSRATQDASIGSEAAALVRGGDLSISALVGTSRNVASPDYVVQRPVSDAI